MTWETKSLFVKITFSEIIRMWYNFNDALAKRLEVIILKNMITAILNTLKNGFKVIVIIGDNNHVS